MCVCIYIYFFLREFIPRSSPAKAGSHMYGGHTQVISSVS